MSKDAIQKDAQESQQEVQQPLSPRDEAMEAIAAKRRGEFEKEEGITLATTDAAPEGTTDTSNDAQISAQLDPIVIDDPSRYRVRTKIDGEEREVTVEEMQREFQKGSAADKRLAEASRRLREVEELSAQLQQQQATAPVTTPAQAPEGVSGAGKEFITAIFEGDDEKAAQAFESAVQAAAGRQPTTHESLSPSEIATQVKQQLVAESALEQSRKDYPELYADPDVENLAAAKITRRMQEGESFADAVQAVGSEFAQKFGWQKQGRQRETNPTTTRTEKLERKEKIDPIRSIQATTTSTEQPPKTNSDIIAEMKAARGGG